MKKMFMAVLTCILISFSAVGLAARFDTCALLIADADMKTEDFLFLHTAHHRDGLFLLPGDEGKERIRREKFNFMI